MTTTKSTETATTHTAATPAVLYICAQRSQEAPGLAQQRAQEEGRKFADQHGLEVVAEIADPYGEPNPQKRSGWMRVREMAERRLAKTVITRWPNALSPDHELRYPELDHLGRHGCQVQFSWAPLAVYTGGGATR
ncbi:hypothetical protein [Streptomyces platensis]|uniref:hypothetical protein n=1 Tax=Streptomyces platensis TaxID=58346 RepID=UPI001F29FC0A|nr:hypothetical protein [Streptomyces platensis]MCF3143777.1 recombinase family protein [Streptomyces platensis]